MLNAWLWKIKWLCNQNCLPHPKYFHTNKVIRYSINPQCNGNCTFGIKPKQAWRAQISHKHGYHRAQVTYLCCIYAAHIYVLSLKYHPFRTLTIQWRQVDYVRPSSPWRCDTIPQDHKPATQWQIHTGVLPQTGSESDLWFALPTMVLWPATLSKCSQSVWFLSWDHVEWCFRPRKMVKKMQQWAHGRRTH